MLLVEGSSQTPLFKDLSDYFFSESVISEVQNLWRLSFSSKHCKFNLDFKIAAKNWKKHFCLWDNCIRIGMVKLSLLRTGYLPSAANVLTSSPRFGMSIRETFSNLIDLAVINEYDKGAVMQISTVLRHVDHIACRSVLWNGTF